jgi:hypothetical protein
MNKGTLNTLIWGLLTTISTTIISCNNSDSDGIPASNSKEKPSNAEKTAVVSNFKDAVLLDSNRIILYPLTFSNEQKEDEGRSYGEGQVAGPYWNIAFYDTQTGLSKLLSSGSAIRINTFQRNKAMMLYSVTSFDHNGDGKLNEQDPTYLFTSDLLGNNFRQITPDRLHVSNFQATSKSGFIVIQAQMDSNKDKKFGSSDQYVPMLFDVSKDAKARNTFSDDFTKEVEKAFNKLYKK